MFLKAPAAAAILVIMTVAGCASSSNTSSPPTATTTVTTTAPAAGGTSSSAPASSPSPVVTGSPIRPACSTSALRVTQGAADGYAGGVTEVIEFTNTSSAPCTLYGYPGVSLVSGASHAQLGLAAKRTTTTPVKLVTLAREGEATAVLQIVDALNFPSGTCGPAKATNLKIYPPNQKAPVYLPNMSYGCAKPVQTLFINAVQAAGKAQPGPGASSHGQ